MFHNKVSAHANHNYHQCQWHVGKQKLWNIISIQNLYPRIPQTFPDLSIDPILSGAGGCCSWQSTESLVLGPREFLGKAGEVWGGGFFWEETTEKNEKKVKCDETRIIGREWNIARTEICTKHMIICLICGFGRSPSSGLRGKIVRIRTNHEKNQSVTLVI
jgi:hypothetical protein